MYPVKVIAETLIWCGVFDVIVPFFDIETSLKSDLSVLENLLSHKCELSVLSILDLA
jgi:hypothetical protein